MSRSVFRFRKFRKSHIFVLQYFRDIGDGVCREIQIHLITIGLDGVE